MKVVNATNEDLATQPPMLVVSKMISTVMLHNGFELGFGLGRNSQGIIEPIPVPIKRDRYGLGYIPTEDDMKMKKISDQVLHKLILHLYHWFPVWEYADRDGLKKGICDLF